MAELGAGVVGMEGRMTRFPRIRALIDSWTNPPAVVPLRRTWGEWFRDGLQHGMKGSVVWFLRFLLWMVG